MCCLGFASLACRASKNAIKNSFFPSEVVSSHSNTAFRDLIERLEGKIRFNDSLSSVDTVLAEINDAETGRYKSVETKEKRITNIFKGIGITVTFVD